MLSLQTFKLIERWNSVGTVLLSGLSARYTSRKEGDKMGEKVKGDRPILAINFKAYPTAFGEKGLAIALAADHVARDYKGSIDIIVAVPATEIARVSDAVSNVHVYAQHADPIEPGAHTGYLPLEALKEAGAEGTLINHSEHRVRLSDIDYIIRRASKLNMSVLACADTPTVAAAVAALSPTIIAIEPPELIGTGIPVSRAKPEIVRDTLKLVRMVNSEVIVLTGAGITSGEDAAAAIRLGTIGVLVASAVMKASDPEAKMRELAEAMIKEFEKVKS
jgi:triosephosphate isomerase